MLGKIHPWKEKQSINHLNPKQKANRKVETNAMMLQDLHNCSMLHTQALICCKRVLFWEMDDLFS